MTDAAFSEVMPTFSFIGVRHNKEIAVIIDHIVATQIMAYTKHRESAPQVRLLLVAFPPEIFPPFRPLLTHPL